MATNPVSAIGQDQFLQLLIAQLQNQDPLNPVTDREFIAQLSSLSTVQGIQSLNASFAEMLKLEQLTQGAALIGRTIEYQPTDGGASVSGAVESLAVQNGKFVLQVGGVEVGLDQVTTVRG